MIEDQKSADVSNREFEDLLTKMRVYANSHGMGCVSTVGKWQHAMHRHKKIIRAGVRDAFTDAGNELRHDWKPENFMVQLSHNEKRGISFALLNHNAITTFDVAKVNRNDDMFCPVLGTMIALYRAAYTWAVEYFCLK